MSEEAVTKLQNKWKNENYDGINAESPTKQDKISTLNLPDALRKTINQTNFYQETKKGKPLASKFDELCIQKRELVIPSFVEIDNHELFLAEQRLGEGQINALSDFIMYFSRDQTKYIEEGIHTLFHPNVIFDLTIDHCGISD